MIAADRQETAGCQKYECGKITWVERTEPPGCLLVTGAGDAAYVDSISEILRMWFGQSREIDIWKIGGDIDTLNQKFFTDRVIPISNDPRLTPEYKLIVVCRCVGQAMMWKTSELSFNREMAYAAVGIGDMAALTLLRKLWWPLPLEEAITLAAFTIHEVKASTEGCGLGTDIVALESDRPGASPIRIKDDEVRQMEDAFRAYQKLERQPFRDWMKGTFDKLHEGRRKRLTPSPLEGKPGRPIVTHRSCRITHDFVRCLRYLPEYYARAHRPVGRGAACRSRAQPLRESAGLRLTGRTFWLVVRDVRESSAIDAGF